MADADALLEITCPRCGAEVSQRFAGPCEACRADLRASMGGAPGAAVEARPYEPKMNVTPNAVATRE